MDRYRGSFSARVNASAARRVIALSDRPGVRLPRLIATAVKAQFLRWHIVSPRAQFSNIDLSADRHAVSRLTPSLRQALCSEAPLTSCSNDAFSPVPR
jgi:hypothetical protein